MENTENLVADDIAFDVADRIELTGPFDRSGEHCWAKLLPDYIQLLGDRNESAYQSRVILLEDTKALGPAHARHDLIGQEGRGHYSHWHNTLYFSTSDNTDPNTNGRTYSLTLSSLTRRRKFNVFGFGSCQVMDPILDLEQRNIAKEIHFNSLATANFTHNIEEHLQILKFYRRDLQIPKPILRHIAGDFEYDPGSSNGVKQENADLVVAELCTPFKIEFSSFTLNRNRIVDNILTPAEGWGSGASTAAHRWFWSGLARGDRSETLAGAKELLPHMPRGSEFAEIDRAIVAEATSRRSEGDEIAAGIEALQRAFEKPLGIITHVLQYMPDGRPIPWPSDFLRQANDICRRLDIPVLNPCRTVMKYGVESGMTEDQGHYRRSFVRVIADDMLLFINRVHAHGYDPNNPGRRLGIPLVSA